MNAQIKRKTSLEFLQSIQILELLYKEELTPYTASILAILFKYFDKKDHLPYIRQWAYSYIESFVYSEPRSQTDLQDKTLAVLTYFLVEDTTDLDHSLPCEFLNKYLDYAKNQAWFENTSLAFMTCFINNHAISKEAKNFFATNMSTFIDEKNFQAICQALFISATLEEYKKNIGTNFVIEYLTNQHIQSFELAWGLIGLTNITNDNESTNKQLLQEKIFEEMNQLNSIFFSNLLSNPSFSGIEFGDLVLHTFSVFLSKNFTTIYVSGIQENELLEFVITKNKIDKGFIPISKPELIISNILSIIFTIQIGVLVGMWVFGVTITNFQISSASFPEIGDIAFLGPIVLILVFQIIATFRGKSSVSVLVDLEWIKKIIQALKGNK